MKLDKVKDSLHRCISCSECYGRGPWLPFVDGLDTITDWVCPTLDYYHLLSYTARGRQYLAREVAYGRMDIDDDIVRVFYSCPDCGICGTMCPRPHSAILRAMREEIAERGYLPPGNKEQNDKIERTHNFFGAAQKDRTKWAKGLGLPKTGRVLYFAGCYASYRQPETARATIKLLRQADIDVAYLGEEEWCCGYHAVSTGRGDIMLEMAGHNLEAIRKSGAELVVLSCPACYRAFKVDYRNADNHPFKVLSVVELLAQLFKDDKLMVAKPIHRKVTYHDPCLMGRQHLDRHYDVYQAPREVIARVPGAELIEMERHGRWADCCGSGCGVVSGAYPEVTEFMAKKRLLQSEGLADILLTTCPRCVETLGRVARQDKKDIEVKDIVDFVAESLA